MKVKKLIVELSKCDPEAIIVIATDSEGNGFDIINNVDGNNLYDKVNKEVGLKQLTPELIKQGYTEEDLGKGESAVTLWP
jgi:hypothetical protein